LQQQTSAAFEQVDKKPLRSEVEWPEPVIPTTTHQEPPEPSTVAAIYQDQPESSTFDVQPEPGATDKQYSTSQQQFTVETIGKPSALMLIKDNLEGELSRIADS